MLGHSLVTTMTEKGTSSSYFNLCSFIHELSFLIHSFSLTEKVLKALLKPLSDEQLFKEVNAIVSLSLALEAITTETPAWDLETAKRRWESLTLLQHKAIMWISGMCNTNIFIYN